MATAVQAINVNARSAGFEVCPLSPIGAEIVGFDIAGNKNVDGSTFKDYLHQHAVIVFRNQNLSPEEQIRFCAGFGRLERHFAHQTYHPKHPELLTFSNIIENGKRKGGHAGPVFHSDVSFEEKPILYSALYSVEVPRNDNGEPLGDTLFVRTDDAYDRLDEKTKQEFAGKKARHSYRSYVDAMNTAYLKRYGKPNVMTDAQREEYERNEDHAHPIFRTHPVTGRKCIYVNEGIAVDIEGMDPEKGRDAIRALCQHITLPQYVYTHKWNEGDLVVWDNCSTQHLAVSNYRQSQRRLLYRCSIQGERPV